MLILTRNLKQTLTIRQSITIGDPKSVAPPIEVTIIEVRGDQVRLGVNAPRETQVHRKEIWLLKQEEEQNSSAAGEVLR